MRARLTGLFLAFCLALTPAYARSNPALDAVLQAQALLGSETWSRVLRIDNGRRLSPYPRVVYALVFELADLLWFYSPVDGTQSLSLHRGQLKQEEANLEPLLHAIDRGFRSWQVIPPASVSPPAPAPTLPNGCFIESVAAWRALWHRGAPPQSAMLVSFYPAGPSGRRGHTVLAYRKDDVLEVHDPDRPDGDTLLPFRIAAKPLDIARGIAGAMVGSARTLNLPAPARLADTGSRRSAPAAPLNRS